MCILTNSDDNCLRIYNTPEQLYAGDTANIPEMVRMKCTFLSIVSAHTSYNLLVDIRVIVVISDSGFG